MNLVKERVTEASDERCFFFYDFYIAIFDFLRLTKKEWFLGAISLRDVHALSGGTKWCRGRC